MSDQTEDGAAYSVHTDPPAAVHTRLIHLVQ